MIFQGLPTQGANIGQQAFNQLAGQYQRTGLEALRMGRIQQYGKRDDLIATLDSMEARRDQKRAEREAGKGTGGWGAIGGTILGALLAIPTGGASLVAMGIGGALGGAVGGGIDRATAGDAVGAGQAVAGGLSRAVSMGQRQQMIEDDGRWFLEGSPQRPNLGGTQSGGMQRRQEDWYY